jgi:hypothetical protein
MRISERYSTARNTSNLKTGASANDILMAVGMAGQRDPEAIALLNLAFGHHPSARVAFAKLIEGKLTEKMLTARWPGKPRQTAMEAIAWYLDGTCQPCGGRKYEVAPGTPMLTDKACKHCHGTGKLPKPPEQLFQYAIDLIERLVVLAESRPKTKLLRN